MPGPVLISEKQADYQDTERSTAQTVAAMGAHVKDSVRDPEVRRVAAECLRSARSHSVPDLARAAWQWCKSNIEFVPDEVQLYQLLGRTGELELLISPAVMVRTRIKKGDCDCFSMMLCVLLTCLDIRPLIRTFKCDSDSPWRWSHVCAAAALPDGSYLNLDASHGDYPGWTVPRRDVYESQFWDMNGNKVGGNMRGLNGYVRESGWTGSEMTSSGRVAGPYPSLDVMTAYRRRGLNAIAAGKFGMGDLESDAAAIAATGGDNTPGPNYIDSITGDLVSGATGQVLIPGSQNPSVGGGGSFNWSNLFGQLLNSGSHLASQAIGSGAQVLPNGNVLLPSGQVVSGSPASSLGISSNALLIGGLLVGGLILVSVLKK